MINIGVFKKRLDRDFKKLKVVSFDVFDTLLIRLLPSECVSKIAAEKLSRLIFHETSIVLAADEILHSRINFRLHRNTTGSRNEEWTLSQWLTALAVKQGIDPELITRLGRQAELESEFLNLRLDHYAIEALNEAKERELMVIATSDMWLDQDWLEDLLIDFQLFFDKVFTSGSLGVSKRKRTIFRVIEKQLALYPDTFLHVGNKFRSDFLQPRVAGWNSLLTYENHPLMRMNLPTKFRKGPFRPKPFEKIFHILGVDPPPENIEHLLLFGV